MSKFEIPSGFVEIENGEFRVNTSALEGLNRLYHHRKALIFSCLIIWIATFWLLFFTDSISIDWMKEIFVVFSLIIVLGLAIEKILIVLELKKQTKIPISSIEKVEFDEFTTTKLSRINVIYSENNTEKTHNVWIRVFGVGSADRLEKALITIRSAGIIIEQGERSKNL